MNKTVLITGANGFLGSHMVLQLLQQGFKIRATLRNLNKKDLVISTLKGNGINDFTNLSFVEADLSNDNNWQQAMAGCDYVLSVASPVFFKIPDNEEEIMRPAQEGIKRILTHARDAKVKRVVMTANFGGVGFSKKKGEGVTTEADWTNENEPGLSAYEKSKLLAEKAAWKFIKEEGNGLEFATINPVAIFGPSLNSHVSGSFSLINMLLAGKNKWYPNIPLNIVDVRDVAELHIKALTTPEANGNRFIASADGSISMKEIASVIKENYPQLSDRVARHAIPDWIINSGKHFSKQLQEGSLMLNINRNVSNQKAKDLLNWHPMNTNEQIIIDLISSMLKYNLI